MKTSITVQLGVGAIILVVVAGAWFTARTKQEQRDLVLTLSMSIGADLAHGTHSSALTGVTAELESDLKRIHASPTRAIVEPGDAAPPVGDGRAKARLVLTNEAGQTLPLRLRPEREPSTGLRKYRVLGYWKTDGGVSTNATYSPQ